MKKNKALESVKREINVLKTKIEVLDLRIASLQSKRFNQQRHMRTLCKKLLTETNKVIYN